MFPEKKDIQVRGRDVCELSGGSARRSQRDTQALEGLGEYFPSRMVSSSVRARRFSAIHLEVERDQRGSRRGKRASGGVAILMHRPACANSGHGHSCQHVPTAPVCLPRHRCTCTNDNTMKEIN